MGVCNDIGCGGGGCLTGGTIVANSCCGNGCATNLRLVVNARWEGSNDAGLQSVLKPGNSRMDDNERQHPSGGGERWARSATRTLCRWWVIIKRAIGKGRGVVGETVGGTRRPCALLGHVCVLFCFCVGWGAPGGDTRRGVSGTGAGPSTLPERRRRRLVGLFRQGGRGQGSTHRP